MTAHELLASRFTMNGNALHWWALAPAGGTITRQLGKPAGGIVGGKLVVSLDGHPIPAARIAWTLHHGKWPAHDVHTRDRNPRNLAADNLAEGPAPRKTRADISATMLDDPGNYWAQAAEFAERVNEIRMRLFGTLKTTIRQDDEAYAVALAEDATRHAPAPTHAPKPDPDDFF